MKFLDQAKIYIKAGDGGSGSASFRREKFIPKGGPDGGDGGRGGHVYMMVDTNLHTLQDIRYRRRYKAENGHKGKGSNKTGRSGKDIMILVPAGSIIRKKGSKKVVVDLKEEGQKHIICHGGQGGRGNTRFKTSTKQAPRNAQPGIDGESGNFEVELKILADVGLVGLPNAGKSTLLSVLSSARPKIADYPFTTLIPNLGVVQLDDFSTFVAADIPGLIEGAHLGKGLGIRFLKHTERSRLLVHLLDFSSSNSRDPLDDYQIVQRELEFFSEKLCQRPQILVASKVDHPEAKKKFETYKSRLRDINPQMHFISSMTGEGVPKLLWKIKETLDGIKAAEIASS